jgi:outer membrane protein
MTEQNAEIMMSRNDLVFAAPSVDVTAVVTSKLDARTPSIAVVRQRLPQQPAAQ